MIYFYASSKLSNATMFVIFNPQRNISYKICSYI